jgi:hypothetical protein
VKYEDIYLKEYASPLEAQQGLKEYFRIYNHDRPHQSELAGTASKPGFTIINPIWG